MAPVTLDLSGFHDGMNLSAMTFRFIVHHGSGGGRFGWWPWLSGRATDREGRVWHFEPLGDDPAVLTCVLCEMTPTIPCGVCNGTGTRRFWHDMANAHFEVACPDCGGTGRMRPLSRTDRADVVSDALRQVWADEPAWRKGG